jgi:hypothetical protein
MKYFVRSIPGDRVQEALAVPPLSGKPIPSTTPIIKVNQ